MNTVRQDVFEFVQQQALTLEAVLQRKLVRYKVQGTDLRSSIRTAVYQQAQGTIGFDLTFAEQGRYLDMGSGRGYSHGKRIGGGEATRATIRGRKSRRYPKKWWTRPFYRWYYQLTEVVSATIVEQTIQSFTILES